MTPRSSATDQTLRSIMTLVRVLASGCVYDWERDEVIRELLVLLRDRPEIVL